MLWSLQGSYKEVLLYLLGHVVESLRQVRVTNHADPVLVHPREVEHSLRIENAALSVCMRT